MRTPLYETIARDLAIDDAPAFLIGWNREREDRSAGMRTFPLVAVAACGFVQATEGLFRGHPEAAARIVAGVITGIGSIGGGAILKNGGEVHGTAIDASLWATWAIGAAVGLASHDVAAAISFTALSRRTRVGPSRHGPPATPVRPAVAASLIAAPRPRASSPAPRW